MVIKPQDPEPIPIPEVGSSAQGGDDGNGGLQTSEPEADTPDAEGVARSIGTPWREHRGRPTISHVRYDDLTDDFRLMELFGQFVKRGVPRRGQSPATLIDNDHNRLSCFVAAQHAIDAYPDGKDKHGNPVTLKVRIAMFFRMMQSLAVHGQARGLYEHVSNDTDDKANERFKQWKHGDPRARLSMTGSSDDDRDPNAEVWEYEVAQPPRKALNAQLIAEKYSALGNKPDGQLACNHARQQYGWTAEEFKRHLATYAAWAKEKPGSVRPVGGDAGGEV